MRKKFAAWGLSITSDHWGMRVRDAHGARDARADARDARADARDARADARDARADARAC